MSAIKQAVSAYPGGQTGLANTLGVTQGAVSHWVTGRRKPPIEKLPALAEAAGISVEELVVDLNRLRAEAFDAEGNFIGPASNDERSDEA